LYLCHSLQHFVANLTPYLAKILMVICEKKSAA